MAQDLRPRSVNGVARWRMLGLLACAACARPSPDPAPRAFDVSTLAAEAVPGAVLDECHRPLRDRMRHLEVTVQLPSGAKWQVFTALPEALRAVGERGSYLVRGSQVFALGAPAPHSVPAPLAAELRALLPLLDAAAFGPLHRAQHCRRDGAHFVLRDASGHETALQLRAGTLLPERFGTGDAAVDCVDYLRTSSTWMVARAASPSLGTVALTFEHAGLDWRPDFFAPPEPATAPASAPTPPPQSTQWSPSGGETRPAVPQLQELRGHSRVLLDDPGDWPGRAAAYLPVHQELERQDQTVFGFPMLLQQQGRSVLAVPFRPRNAARTFQAPAGWRIVAVPAGRQLVVFPPQGDFAARRQDGERLLHSALTAQALTATGELVCQPYLHLEDGPPTAAQLEALTVRMSVPVR